MTSTLVNQNGSGKVGLAGPDSLSSSSEPFDVVNSLSEPDLSNEHIEESVKSMICSCKSPEALEEVAIKPPGETILSAWSDNEIEAFDSKFDSNALPGSALTEVALDPGFLKMRKILAQVELQLYNCKEQQQKIFLV